MAVIVQIPSVQTALVRHFTEMISERLGEATVSVGTVRYALFNRLIVDDVYVSDVHGDTLLNVHQVAVTLSRFSIPAKKVQFSAVRLYDGVFNLHNTDSSTNIKDVLAPLKNESDTGNVKANKKPWVIKVKAFGLSDFRFTFTNNRKPMPDYDSVINFSKLNVRDINLDVDKIRLENDTLFFRMNRLAFEERSGYRIKQLRVEDGYVCGTRVMLRDLLIHDDYSNLNLRHYAMNYTSADDLSDYVEKVRMEADFDSGKLSSHTIGYFAKGLKKADINITLDGFAEGTVDNLRSDSLFVASESGKTYLLFKFRMRGLPEIDETMITLDMLDMKSHAADLSTVLKSIVPSLSDSVASFIKPFEHIYLTGSFAGLYNDFVANAKMRTAIGDVSLDMQMNVADVRKDGLVYRGHINAHDFQLGSLIKSNLFGGLSLQMEATGMILPEEKGGISVDARGDINDFEFNGYAYQHISLSEGHYSQNEFSGNVQCNDPNLQFEFRGIAGTNPEKNDSTYRYHFDFSADVKYADLWMLNINRRDTLSKVRGKVDIEYYMKSFLDGQGHFELAAVDYIGPVDSTHYDRLRVDATYEDSLYKFKMRSAMLDADYTGSNNLEYFFKYLLRDTYKRHISSVDSTQEREKVLRKHDYLFNARLKETRSITNSLLPGLAIADNTDITAVLDMSDSLKLQINSNFLAYKDNVLKKVNVVAGSNTEKLNLDIKISDADIFGLSLLNAGIVLNARESVIDAKILFDDRKTTGANNALIAASTHFADDSVRLQILPSTLVLNDSTWKFVPAEIVFKDSLIRFNNLRVNNHKQELKINGVFSYDPNDMLRVDLVDFDISMFDVFLKKAGYGLKGKLSGNAHVMDAYNVPVFFADLNAEEVKVNDRPLGALEVDSKWNNEQKQLLLNVKIQDDNGTPLSLTGYYMPAARYLDVSGRFSKFKVYHLEPFLDGVMHNLAGDLSGTITLNGPSNALNMRGSNVRLDNAALTIDFLNTSYSFSSPVDITPSRILLRNVEMADEKGGKGTFTANFSHNHFYNLMLDISLYPQNMLVLNTTDKDNESFYGTAYVSGMATIKGHPSSLAFDITARTERNTVFSIPIQSEKNAREMNMLTFVQPPAKETDEADEYLASLKKIDKEKKTKNNLQLNMNVDATPEAEVQIVFDEKAGDVIRAFGNGNIRLDVRPAYDIFNVLGDYVIERGDYLFTLADLGLVNKQFYLEQGGRVMFNGDVKRTTLDLSAVYKTKAALNRLIYDTTSVANNRPVDCTILLSGALSNPVVNLKIDVQNIDPETKARVQAALNTEEKVTRQFASLLAFNSFLPDEQSGVTANLSLAGTAMDMLSNQVNNILKQLGVTWNVGVMYTPSQNGRSDMIDVAISKEFFNNRLVINGNVGNVDKTSSTEFAGDFDAEYKLDEKGRFRLKAFTHSADQFSDNLDNTQRSGVGFIYQEEFNTFPELFQRLFKRKKKAADDKLPAKKEEEDVAPENISSSLEFKKE